MTYAIDIGRIGKRDIREVWQDEIGKRIWGWWVLGETYAVCKCCYIVEICIWMCTRYILSIYLYVLYTWVDTQRRCGITQCHVEKHLDISQGLDGKRRERKSNQRWVTCAIPDCCIPPPLRFIKKEKKKNELIENEKYKKEKKIYRRIGYICELLENNIVDEQTVCVFMRMCVQYIKFIPCIDIFDFFFFCLFE